MVKTPNKSNQNQKPNCQERCDPLSEQPSGLLTKEIGKDVLFGCESTNSRMVRLVNGQPTGLFTQLEEIDIDFRVSGLPHAVVNQAGKFRVREFVKKIESHPHRDAFQADLQQNNIYNPFSDNSKAMIREMQCRVIRVMRNSTKSAMFSMPSLLESRSDLLHLRTPLG